MLSKFIPRLVTLSLTDIKCKRFKLCLQIKDVKNARAQKGLLMTPFYFLRGLEATEYHKPDVTALFLD